MASGTGSRGSPNDVRITNVSGNETKGVWYDGTGDFMAVISHKPGTSVARENFGCRVTADAFDDMVFRNPDGVKWSGKGDAFTGTAGVIRKKKAGGTELAVFHGSLIGAGGVTLEVDNPDLGVSAAFADPAEIAGTCFGRAGGQLAITAANGFPEAAAIYVDGARLESQRAGNRLTATLPAGRHRWQLAAGLPTPIPPTITRTENRSGAATVFFTPVAGAARYRAELSEEGGTTWKPAATIDQPAVSTAVRLDWGEVLGVAEYRVYRRAKAAGEFAEVYRGRQRSCVDPAASVVPAFDMPGHLAAAARPADGCTIYEYAVTAVTGNGESAKSAPVDTDPASWANWDPKPGERFRRYDSEEGPVYYPE